MRHRILLTMIFASALLLPSFAGAEDAVAPSAPAKSAKERLSDKASDEQRVDNCHVPLDRRGSKPRPDCPPAQAGTPSPADTAAISR